MKNKIEPYFNPLSNILFYIIVFILFGMLMYCAIVLTEKYPWLQVQFGALWFLGFVLASFYTFLEICEIGRIKKLQKRFREKK